MRIYFFTLSFTVWMYETILVYIVPKNWFLEFIKLWAFLLQGFSLSLPFCLCRNWGPCTHAIQHFPWVFLSRSFATTKCNSKSFELTISVDFFNFMVYWIYPQVLMFKHWYLQGYVSQSPAWSNNSQRIIKRSWKDSRILLALFCMTLTFIYFYSKTTSVFFRLYEVVLSHLRTGRRVSSSGLLKT